MGSPTQEAKTLYKQKSTRPTEARSSPSQNLHIHVLPKWLVLEIKIEDLCPSSGIRITHHNLEAQI